MLFGLFILILAAAVAFFHYVQGFFSAMISMILVIISAAMALSFHENVAQLAFSSFAPAQGYSLSLVLLFGAIYIVLRILFDKLVPGNIQVPVIADKVGAGVFGLIAGIFGAGILAIAAQALPFGPVIGGYARFPVQDRLAQSVKLANKTNLQDLPVFEELNITDLSASDINTMFRADSGRASSLLVPVDDWTVGLVSYLSSGSLAGERPLSSVHPAYINELFAQRLGIQIGAKRVIPDDGSALKFEKASLLSSPRMEDREMQQIRGKGRLDAAKAPEGQLIGIRVRPSSGGADSDGFTRFSPASVRLVGPLPETSAQVSYYPIGTLSDGETIVRNLPDDPLFLKSGKAVDLVFAVEPKSVVVVAGSPKFADGVFLEMKRLARVSLAGQPVELAGGLEKKEDVGVLTRESK